MFQLQVLHFGIYVEIFYSAHLFSNIVPSDVVVNWWFVTFIFHHFDMSHFLTTTPFHVMIQCIVWWILIPFQNYPPKAPDKRIMQNVTKPSRFCLETTWTPCQISFNGTQGWDLNKVIKCSAGSSSCWQQVSSQAAIMFWLSCLFCFIHNRRKKRSHSFTWFVLPSQWVKLMMCPYSPSIFTCTLFAFSKSGKSIVFDIMSNVPLIRTICPGSHENKSQ